jgi:hypothetical protein
MRHAQVKWSNENERSIVYFFNSGRMAIIAGLYIAKVWREHLTCTSTTGCREKD